jgi:hypothetical protein
LIREGGKMFAWFEISPTKNQGPKQLSFTPPLLKMKQSDLE